MNESELSKRLSTVAKFIKKGSFFADIGSDHAYLPCYVCLKDDTANAIAGELNQGPFQSAQRQVRQTGLEKRIEVRKGDGLSVLQPEEVDTVVIAGMGGSLIRTILEQGKDRLQGVKRIIAQPNIDEWVVREWFLENKYCLTAEIIIKEGEPIYEVLVADFLEEPQPYDRDYIKKELMMGPFLLKEHSPVFIEKWERELRNKKRIMESMKKAKEPNQRKLEEFQKETEWIEEELNREDS
ncbi:tRNA (adenine(22)-N(1))-methyltransferase TrmK [Bacillaceae bacterium S4-13-58]